MERRQFNRNLLQLISSYTLLESVFYTDAFGKKIKPNVAHWAIRLSEYCADLKREALSLIDWQYKVEALFNEIPLEEIVKFIDFEKLAKGMTLPDLGVKTAWVKFPKLTGLPENTAFVKKIFGMQKDRAIIPHGHSNMASAHLILKGEMHLRHYDKVGLEERHMLIKPTIDKMATIGSSSSISDENNNVHWFIAKTETAYTFDVIMLDLQEENYNIHNLDIYKQVKLGNGTLRVPMLDVATALKKYGKHSHH